MSHLVSTQGGGERAPKRGCWSCDRIKKILREEDTVKWAKNMRGSVSLVASIIATMSFALATNPPGGVFQASSGDDVKSCLENLHIHCPGEAVLGVVYGDRYKRFLISNTTSFFASLSVCLLLVSGIPLKHRFVIWLLSIGMCITISSLALTYIFAARMVTPDNISFFHGDLFVNVMWIWFGLLGIVFLFIILRMLLRVGEWFTKWCC